MFKEFQDTFVIGFIFCISKNGSERDTLDDKYQLKRMIKPEGKRKT
jgi:hypothetical protein